LRRGSVVEPRHTKEREGQDYVGFQKCFPLLFIGLIIFQPTLIARIYFDRLRIFRTGLPFVFR
jgi:hypothetical protein